jgi:processive 1,2-diacylglycerol beta-glucosyltransferase
MPVHLFDLANGRELGNLSDEQFAFLAEHLEAEDADDDDYYVNQATLDALQDQGADPQVLALLRTALAGRSEMDIRWQRDEPERTASDQALE